VKSGSPEMLYLFVETQFQTQNRFPLLLELLYHAETPAGNAYVKLTLRPDGAPVIQFKDLEP
jgi:hypothetical protein